MMSAKFSALSTVLACLTILSMTGIRVCAVSISSAEPGNVFVEDQPINLLVATQTPVHYECIDFWSKTVASGESTPTGGCAQVVLGKLPPGWYQVRCGDASATVGVVVNRGNAPLPASGRICCNLALLGKPANETSQTAQLIARAGIPWVREFISWRETEPKPGQYEWKKYDRTIDALHEAGLHVDEVGMWDETPVWSHPLGGESRYLGPEDLRDAYRWSAEAAKHFAGRVEAWETWNEPDLKGNWLEGSDRLAGLQKACYLGDKDGCPDSQVLFFSLAYASSPGTPTQQLLDDLYRSGVGGYFDLFNWHTYQPYGKMPQTLTDYRQQEMAHAVPLQRAWLSETGLNTRGSLEYARNQISQARFVGPSAVTALAAGDEKYFYFIARPDPVYGCIRADMTTYPAFEALSAAADILGESRYVGRYKTDSAVQAHLFETANGRVLAAWAETPCTIDVPVSDTHVTLRNLFGQVVPLVAKGGHVTLGVGPEIVYLTGANVHGRALIEPSPISLANGSGAVGPSRVVLAGSQHTEFDVSKAAYLCARKSSIDFQVEACNLDKDARQSGEVSLRLPSGWTAAPASIQCSLEPMGRQMLDFNLTPPSRGGDKVEVLVTGRFSNQDTAPSLTRLVIGSGRGD